MTPIQVCLLGAVATAVVAASWGAPLAPVAPPLHTLIAARAAPPPSSAPHQDGLQEGDDYTADPQPADDSQYDYYFYEYADYLYDEVPLNGEVAESESASEEDRSSVERKVDKRITQAHDVVVSAVLKTDGNAPYQRASKLSLKQSSGKDKLKQREESKGDGAERLSPTLPTSESTIANTVTTSRTSPRALKGEDITTLSSSTTESTTRTLTASTAEPSASPVKADHKSRISNSGRSTSVSHQRQRQKGENAPHNNLVEQEVSGSARVLTYHLQNVHHQRVAKSAPRSNPDFFVPPIRRKTARRRVPLTSQNRPDSSSSLAERLAQQVRQQLAQIQADERQWVDPQQREQQADDRQRQLDDQQLERDQQQWQGDDRERQREEQPYQQPSSTEATPPSLKPVTTPPPYKHPFIPSPPTTTSEPYKHPFIPSSPTTTSEPYKHPFIPMAPTTTSTPYKHPFIPSPPTTTSEPYRHPFIPVPPETTGRPHGGPHGEPAPTSRPRPAEGARPQARRIPDAVVPRLHLPRRKPSSTTQSPPSTTPAHRRSSATIVHEERVQEGFIVGEYGEVSGGGTVRGVKYAADSSVDRSLLEAALKQFLSL